MTSFNKTNDLLTFSKQAFQRRTAEVGPGTLKMFTEIWLCASDYPCTCKHKLLP